MRLLLLAGVMGFALSGFAQATATPAAAADGASGVAYVPTITFDVASIHESRPGPEMHLVGGSFAAHSSNLKLENVDLFWFLSIGYGVDYHQISGQPDWAGRTILNVQAKSDAAADQKMATLDKDQVKLEQQHMVQALLAERFNLKVHWSTQEGYLQPGVDEGRIEAAVCRQHGAAAGGIEVVGGLEDSASASSTGQWKARIRVLRTRLSDRCLDQDDWLNDEQRGC